MPRNKTRGTSPRRNPPPPSTNSNQTRPLNHHEQQKPTPPRNPTPLTPICPQPRQSHLPEMRQTRTRSRPHHPNKPRRNTQPRKPPRTLSPMPQKENNTRNPHRKGKEEKASQPATTTTPRTHQLTTRINNSLTSDRFAPKKQSTPGPDKSLKNLYSKRRKLEATH